MPTPASPDSPARLGASTVGSATRLATTGPVELFRSHDLGAVQQVLDVLDQAGIAHQLIGGAGGFDFTSIGSELSEEKIINIRTTDHSAARTALEEDSLKSDLPENHHLLHSTDDELIEIITHSSEWSPFDVAHARTLEEWKKSAN